MKIDGKVALIAGIVAIGTGFNVFWSTFGWITPNGHDEIEATNAAQFQSVSLQQKAFRDEWYCDEVKEGLTDMLEKQDAGDTSATLAQEISEERMKFTDTDCHRFDDN